MLRLATLVGVLVAEDLAPLLAGGVHDDAAVADQHLLAGLHQAARHRQRLRLLHDRHRALGLVRNVLEHVLRTQGKARHNTTPP